MKIKSQAPRNNAENYTKNIVVAEPLVINREVTIDMWRGLAVILMILTHAISFFHVGENSILNFLGTLGGTVSFTLFLFLSGTAVYFSFIRLDATQQPQKVASKSKKMFLRCVWLLIGYYTLSFVAAFPSYRIPPDITWIENIVRSLLFIDIAPFAEFLLPFIFYGLLVIPLRTVFKFLARNPLALLVVGAFTYSIGTILSGVDVPTILEVPKSLLFGTPELHTFPLFQYLGVYLLGMSWGRFLIRYQSKQYRVKIATLVALTTGVLMVAGYISFAYTGFEWLEPLYRFPPSLTFIIIGLFTGYLVFVILNVTNNLSFLGSLTTFTQYAGLNAFDFFFFHTLVLFVYKYISGDRHYDSILIVSLLFFALIVITTVMTVAKDNVLGTLAGEKENRDGFGWLLNGKVLSVMVWVLVFIAAGMGIYQSRTVATEFDNIVPVFKKRFTKEESWPFWWDHSYNFFRQIFIDNSQNSSTLFRDNWVKISIDHANLVGSSKSDASGKDVRIVYYSESDGLFNEIPLVFEGINSSNASISFQTASDIAPRDINDKYFVYYGNLATNSYPKSQISPGNPSYSTTTLSDEYSHKLSGETNRKWILKEGGMSLQSGRTLLYTVTLSEDLPENSIVTYGVVGTDMRGAMENLGGRKYKATIGVSNLDAGVYKIQATARHPDDKLTLIESGYTPFFVTYPLYVTWTQDWEGWNVPPDMLAGLNELAVRYNVPLTHFFNPRIYATSEVSDSDAGRMTNWVQERVKNYNDEIGLHLHMWYDMVQAAGVTPRYAPYCSFLYPNGGGVAAYAYTKDEMKQILKWARDQFIANGLPVPISFRAGGWLLKEHTLEALAESGFLIDSTGRTAFTQSGCSVPWNLTETTKPYKPNVNDMNSSAQPSINIWEFPNNGQDSIWFDQYELIRRFDLNYPVKGDVMREPQVLTYLSHPPFFYIDKPRMEATFNHISNYLYEKDSGPVVYTTLENAYYSWLSFMR